MATDAVEINAVTLFGNLCVDVPEGVEVELGGFDVLGDRELRLGRCPAAPAPRLSAFVPTEFSET